MPPRTRSQKTRVDADADDENARRNTESHKQRDAPTSVNINRSIKNDNRQLVANISNSDSDNAPQHIEKQIKQAKTPCIDDNESVENDENVFESVDKHNLRHHPRRHSIWTAGPILLDITDRFRDKDSPSPVVPPRNWREKRRPKKSMSRTVASQKPTMHSPLPPSSPIPSSSHYEPKSPSRRERFVAGPSGHTRNLAPCGSDPFGIVAAEKRLRAKRMLKPASKLYSPSVKNSTPQIIAIPHRQPSLAPQPTNDEDFDDLYAEMDETEAPIPAPVFVPLLARASALEQPSSQFLQEAAVAPTFPDPLRTPRKRKRKPLEALSPALLTPNSSCSLSSPSPVKQRTHSAPKTRDQRVNDHGNDVFEEGGASEGEDKEADETPTKKTNVKPVVRKGRGKGGDGDSPREAVRKLEALLPTRPTRTRVTAARRAKSRMDSDAKDEKERKAVKPKTKKRVPSSKAKPKAKSKGKLKVQNVELGLDDEDQEKYERERQARLDYFKKLENYQIARENVYIV